MKRAFSSGPAIRRISDGIAEVPSLNLMGEFATSPGGRFTLVWSDSDPSGMRGGSRESGRGRYALLDGDQVVAQGSMERPNDGHVNDAGTFVLTDWGFGDALRSEFAAFDSNGAVLIRERFRANAFSSGLASDASQAACQLCNNDTKDGGMLVIFDLRSRTRVAQFVPETGWAQEYDFDTARGRIGLNYPEYGTFWYSLDGTLINRDAWTAAQLRSGNGFQILEIARQQLQSASRPLSAEAVTSLIGLGTSARARLADYPRDQAKADRFCGEVSEEVGDVAAAITYYERALAIDPRCGVKKRHAALVRQAL